MLNKKIHHPDEVCIYISASAMKYCYNTHNIQPVFLIFYSGILLMLFSVITFIYFTINHHKLYNVGVIFCGFWTFKHWLVNANLRKDAQKTWDQKLYKQYAFESAYLRDQMKYHRYVTLAAGAVCIALIFYLSHILYLGAAVLPALGFSCCPISILSYIYLRSATPPEPSSGSLRTSRTAFQM